MTGVVQAATETVAGPMTEQIARDVAASLGSSNHSVYSTEKKDAEGYGTGEHEWFVERDNRAPVTKVLGYAWQEIAAMQQRSSC